MPAANNARNVNLNILKAKLETITKAAGYQNDIGKVTRLWRYWEDFAPNELPAICILDDGDETVTQYGTPDTTVLSECHVQLVCYVRNDNATDENALSETFNKFKADLDKLMWSFNTFAPDGGTAEDIRIIRYSSIITVPPYIIFQVDVKFDYYFLKANP